MQLICGFVVVRKPEYATNERLKLNLRIGGKTYRGIDRLRWEDLDQAYYDGRLPARLLPTWRLLDLDSNDLTGLSLLRDYQSTREVLGFSGDRSEIIAIWSPELEDIKGATPSDVGLTYFGIDCVCLGEWSILLDGVYARPDLFPESVAKLNEYGLFNDEADCSVAFETYMRMAAEDRVEPLARAPKMINLRIFGVVEGEAK